MPLLLQHIDAIAREKNRDVLFVHFEEYNHEHPEKNTARNKVLDWLDLQNIEYTPCMGLEGEAVLSSYSGDIYVDVPFDAKNPAYRTLSELLEDEQGNMKIDGVLFFSLALDIALEIEAERENEEEIEIEYLDDEEFGDQFGEGFIENPEAQNEAGFEPMNDKKS